MLKVERKIGFSVASLICALLVLVVYLPGLPGAFVFDDIGSIVENPAIRLHDLSWESLLQAALSSPGGGLLRPLSMLSFALDAYFFGLSPFAFKLTNIFIHLGCGILLGFLTREILSAAVASKHYLLSRWEISWLSLAIALLWCVHPLNLTTVLYTVQRENSLAAAFSAASMLAYMTGRNRQRGGRSGRSFMWLWCPLAMVVGVLCKENAALVPVFLFLIEFTLLGFKAKDDKISREVLLFFTLFLVLPGLLLIALIATHPTVVTAGYANRDYGLYQRLLSEPRILLDYLHWAVLPDLGQLGLFHDDILPSTSLLQPPSTLWSILGVAALLAAALALRSRLPLLSLGILWFFAGHLVESTALPLELAFEHRNYLPLFGIMLGVVSSIYLYGVRQGEKRLVAALIMIGVVAMCGATAVRASDWSTELRFARSESTHHPASPRALAELEWAYLNYIVTTHDTSLVPMAVEAARRSKAADGHSINQDISLAYMYSRLGDMLNAKSSLKDAAEDAKSAHVSATLQFALQTLIDMSTPENRELFPDITDVFKNVLANPLLLADDCYAADMWNSFSLFQNSSGEIPAAIGAIHKAVVLCPSSSQLRANFVRLLLQYGDLRDAKPQLDALRKLHDIRRSGELLRLQEEYDSQRREKGK